MSNGNIQQAELWWALLTRVLSFILGSGILIWQTVFEKTDRLYIIVAGIALCGPAVAQSVATVFDSMRGNKS